MAIEKIMAGIPIVTNEIHPMLQLYLKCCPAMDFNFRFLPKAGGYNDQDALTMKYFDIIETRIKNILSRKKIIKK